MEVNAKEAVISRYPEAFSVIGPYFINIFADPSRDDSMNHLGCALFKHGEMAAWEDAFERTSEDDELGMAGIHRSSTLMDCDL